MSTTFAEYAAKARLADTQIVLGSLVYYTVEALSISHDELVAHLERLGLDDSKPPKPNDADVFRRVSSAAARKRVSTGRSDSHQNFLIRELNRAGGNVNRRIVCETVDLKGRKLDYQELVQLDFNGITGNLTTQRMTECVKGDDECETAVAIATEIQEHYKASRGCLDSYGVRELIRKTLLSLNATCVKPGSGGLYFAMADRIDKIMALEELADAVDGVSVHSLPLLDDTKQRAMLRRAVEVESIEEIDRTVGELGDLVQAGTEISHARFAELQRRYSAIVDKTKEYASLLEESSATTEIRLNIFGRKMAQILGQVK